MSIFADQLSTMIMPIMLMRSEGDKSKIILSIVSLILIAVLNTIVKKMTNQEFDGIMALFRKKKTDYKIKGSITLQHNLFFNNNMSITFKAVMHDLYSKIIEDKDTKAKYNIIEELAFRINNNPMKFVIFTNPRTTYSLTDSVSVCHELKKTEKEHYTYQYYELSLSSNDNNMNTVVEYINRVLDKYDKDQVLKLQKPQIYTLNGFDKEGDVATYNELSFNTNKSFSNMFFEDKKRLVHRIDMFEKSKERFQYLGMPYTFGLMFHGEPGTGKTSAIKAIANYTQRHIILVSVKKVNTLERLQNIFLTERINDIPIPMEKRLYVFDDVDCSQWRNVVLDRKYKKDCSQAVNDKSTAENIADCLKEALCTEVRTNDKAKDKQEFDLTLGDLLEILDGMIEMPGRMIIMTTNHPDMLDPALLRPGRIDMKIEFKKLTRTNIKDIYRLWFDKEIPDECFAKLKDFAFSQAEIGNIFATMDEGYILKALQER